CSITGLLGAAQLQSACALNDSTLILAASCSAFAFVRAMISESRNAQPLCECTLGIALAAKFANLNCGSRTPWCNGNTAPFGGVILGSNPSGVATVLSDRLLLKNGNLVDAQQAA